MDYIEDYAVQVKALQLFARMLKLQPLPVIVDLTSRCCPEQR